MNKRQVLVDYLSADSGLLLKLYNKIPSIKKIHFSHTNSSGIARKVFKTFPSYFLASRKENHILAVTEIKNVCRFMPAVKPPDGLTGKLLYLAGGGGGTHSCP